MPNTHPNGSRGCSSQSAAQWSTFFPWRPRLMPARVLC
jgi:hypothetical protein